MKGRSTLSLFIRAMCMRNYERLRWCEGSLWVVSFSLSQFHAIAPASSFYECWDETLNYCCADVCNRTNAFTTSGVSPLFYSQWNVKWITERQVAHPISLLFMNRNGWNLVSSHSFWRCFHMQNFSSPSLVLSELWSDNQGNHSISLKLLIHQLKVL